ncbi:MAG: pilus assembly protein PilP [Wenzhouxiangella sp.]|nr:pilus assembly protein PilP [Wenzhouxiangella sp.]MCH8479096.1 pilus assembly protein PilP [Wenzhouxiangella sp.]TVR97653.1 MAG: pilus assembly protein PilP [Wenzhouxiangellaceae bacterium]
MKNRWQSIGLLIVILAVTAGCERGTRDLEHWVAETLRTPAGDIDPIPPVVTPEIVSYVAYDLRDPFQRRVARADEAESDLLAGANGVRPDPDRRREFLEGFPLDTLRMVGTFELEGVNYALIRDNDNVVHRVAEGNYMGSNHGRVVRVRSDRVELVELYEDPRGGWVERRAQLVMAES